MDIPFPDKKISVDLELLKKLKDGENLDILSLLLLQRSGDQYEVKNWALAHVEDVIKVAKALHEKEDWSKEKRAGAEIVIRLLEQRKRDIQNEATIYRVYG